MIRIIEGKRYNTETATSVLELPCSYSLSDFAWHETTLYRTGGARGFLLAEATQCLAGLPRYPTTGTDPARASSL